MVKSGEDPFVTTEPSILNVWYEHGQANEVHSILIDIPIGLPASGTRACDQEASNKLGSRAGSVFSIPRREVVEADEYPHARELNQNSLGSQSWWLFPRIREVDVFLQEYPSAMEKIYESHPEICFEELSGGLNHAKDTKQGREERLRALREDAALHDCVEDVIFERQYGAEWHDRISKGRLDDVLDAAVLSLTAQTLGLGPRPTSNEYPSLPDRSEPRVDEALEIHPQIIYPDSQ